MIYAFTQYYAVYAVYAVYAEILCFTQFLRSITQPNFITHPTREGGASPPPHECCVMMRNYA